MHRRFSSLQILPLFLQKKSPNHSCEWSFIKEKNMGISFILDPSELLRVQLWIGHATVKNDSGNPPPSPLIPLVPLPYFVAPLSTKCSIILFIPLQCPLFFLLLSWHDAIEHWVSCCNWIHLSTGIPSIVHAYTTYTIHSSCLYNLYHP